MPRNKPGLHIALYARPKFPDFPHMALLICPKNISSTRAQGQQILRHHVKNTFQVVSGAAAQPWVYEHMTLASLQSDPRILLCVAIGKLVVPAEEVATILQVKLYQVDDADREKAKRFDCVEWVRCGVDALRERGAVSGMPEWEVSREKAMAFLKSKREAGRWSAARGGPNIVPVLELIGGVERVIVD